LLICLLEGSALEGHFPMERCLVIVARDHPELWRDLTNHYAFAEGVEVILDRRQRDRWQGAQSSDLQALGIERRNSSSIDIELQQRPFVVVTQP
jgi:hypothetical protein